MQQPVFSTPLCSQPSVGCHLALGLSILGSYVPTDFSVVLFFYHQDLFLMALCSMVLDRPDELVTCPCHLSLRCLTIARRSVYGPISLINRSHFTYSHSIAKVCLEENSSVYLRIFRCAQSHILLCSYIENLSLHFEGQVLETAVVHPFGNSSKLAEQVLVNLVNKHRYVDFLCYRFSRVFCSMSIAFGRSIF